MRSRRVDECPLQALTDRAQATLQQRIDLMVCSHTAAHAALHSSGQPALA